MNGQDAVTPLSIKSPGFINLLWEKRLSLWRCGVALLIFLFTWQDLTQLTADLCYLTARQMFTTGHADSALWLLRQTEQLQSNQPLLYNLSGYILYQRQDLSASKRQLTAGIKINKSETALLNNLAVLSYTQRDSEQAIQFQQQAAKAATTVAIPHYNLGLLAWQRGDTITALRALREAARIDPTWEKPYLYLSLIYLTQAQYVLAEEYAQEAIVLQPEQASGYDIYIQALLAQGEGQRALAVMMQAPKHTMDRDRLRLYEAFALRATGNLADAKPLLEKLFRWSHDSLLRYRVALELRSIKQ